MGVPGFFAWLLKNYKKTEIITNQIYDDVDILYLDANCLFHPQCFKVLNFYEEALNINKLESKMIKRILNYMDYLIALVNPKKEVFIAVDGVAPLAKINQQRKRRYKSIIDNEIRNNIKKKYKKLINNSWNNTVITPGTKFMEKLHCEILNHIKKNKLNLKIKYTYSSYHTIGEGEHKILQDIRKKSLENNKKDKNDKNNKREDVYVIYGLDADLIFLSLASKKQKIYLLREETLFSKFSKNIDDDNEIINIVKDVAENLNFVSMDETRKSINDQIQKIIDQKIEYPKINYHDIDFCDDFIFLCFLLGNDFIPAIPSINIKNSGLNFILDIYVDTYLILKTNLIFNDGNILINEIFFELFILNLSKYEEYYFKIKYPKYVENLDKKKCLSEDQFEKEIWELENLKGNKIDDPIKLGVDEQEVWKFRYYEFYYGTIRNQENHIFKMCEEYLKGMVWTLQYYFKQCQSWEWQYIYHHAPFISDLSYYFKKNKFDFTKINFPISKPLKPLIQLLAVIPPSCHEILPKEYGKLMYSPNSEIIDMFPIEVKLDKLYKESFHKCMPFIPNINISRFENAVINIKLSQDEKERNEIKDNIIISYEK